MRKRVTIARRFGFIACPSIVFVLPAPLMTAARRGEWLAKRGWIRCLASGRVFRRAVFTLLYFFAWTGSSTIVCAQTVDDDIAMAFYPAALDAEFRDNHPPEIPVSRTFSSMRINGEAGGSEDYLAVAYYNGMASSLRVIRGTTAADSTLIAESPDRTMGGRGKPVLEAVDIDNDGVPELSVAFRRATWIYKFKNGALTLFCPTELDRGSLTSNLGEAAFTDIDGDGVLEVIDVSAFDGTGHRIYQVDTTGAFNRMGTTAIFADRFEGGSTVTRRFAATAGVDYVVRIVNGDQIRRDTASAVEIAVNGVSTVVPSDMGISTRALSVPIRLQEMNELTIQVTGPPESLVWITIIRAGIDL